MRLIDRDSLLVYLIKWELRIQRDGYHNFEEYFALRMHDSRLIREVIRYIEELPVIDIDDDDDAKPNSSMVYGKIADTNYNSQKYECHLEYQAEGVTSGTMMLTKDEYELVKRVIDTDNWDNFKAEEWSGSLDIWCDELE